MASHRTGQHGAHKLVYRHTYDDVEQYRRRPPAVIRSNIRSNQIYALYSYTKCVSVQTRNQVFSVWRES